MLIYMDNCCFNRPFDDQSSLIVQLETEAKLHIQEAIRRGEHMLCWSFVLDYENGANPFIEVRNRIAEWKNIASVDCNLTDELGSVASDLLLLGLRQMDAAHIACAIHLAADCFITTDKKVLNKSLAEIAVLNPIDFVRRYSSAE